MADDILTRWSKAFLVDGRLSYRAYDGEEATKRIGGEWVAEQRSAVPNGLHPLPESSFRLQEAWL